MQKIAIDTITTVFFDIDNTLIDHTNAQLAATQTLQKKYFRHVPKETFTATWLEFQKKYWELYMQKEISFLEQRTQRIAHIWTVFEKSIDKKEIDEVLHWYYEVYENAWNSFESVDELFETIKAKNIKIGIISNGNKKQQIKKLIKVSLLSYIDQNLFFVSEDIGLSKPNPRFFTLAQEKAKALPENILFIGDDNTLDIEPSKKLGWNTILIDHFSAYPNQDAVPNFQEVIKVLQK